MILDITREITGKLQDFASTNKYFNGFDKIAEPITFKDGVAVCLHDTNDDATIKKVYSIRGNYIGDKSISNVMKIETSNGLYIVYANVGADNIVNLYYTPIYSDGDIDTGRPKEREGVVRVNKDIAHVVLTTVKKDEILVSISLKSDPDELYKTIKYQIQF